MMSAVESASTARRIPSRYGPTGDCTNECTDWTTPLRVRKSPNDASTNVALTSTMFQTLSMPFFSCTITECRNAVAASHGMSAAFSTGSHAQKPPQPISSYAQCAPSSMPMPSAGHEHERPAPHGHEPARVGPAGDERRHRERERDGHRT